MRPPDLPDFKNPPVGEVVLGVQFSSPSVYSQIRAGEVWDLFRATYPRAEEHQPIPPAFETFGTNSPGTNQISFLDGPLHDRYWFMSADSSELLQFQQDRLLHNWRKATEQSAYPRFEKMINQFRDELQKLESYFSALDPQALQINQCEISYVNHIAVEPGYSVSDWITVANLRDNQPDGFSLSLRETIRDGAGIPQSRLHCEVAEVTRPTGQTTISVALTARGAPTNPTISSAVDFLTTHRSIIVNRFAEITSETAHKCWERIR